MLTIKLPMNQGFLLLTPENFSVVLMILLTDRKCPFHRGQLIFSTVLTTKNVLTTKMTLYRLYLTSTVTKHPLCLLGIRTGAYNFYPSGAPKLTLVLWCLTRFSFQCSCCVYSVCHTFQFFCHPFWLLAIFVCPFCIF